MVSVAYKKKTPNCWNLIEIQGKFGSYSHDSQPHMSNSFIIAILALWWQCERIKYTLMSNSRWENRQKRCDAEFILSSTHTHTVDFFPPCPCPFILIPDVINFCLMDLRSYEAPFVPINGTNDNAAHTKNCACVKYWMNVLRLSWSEIQVRKKKQMKKMLLSFKN